MSYNELMKEFIKPIQAHCDVPCGIYETDSLKHSAQTCLSLLRKAADLTETKDLNAQNQLVRLVLHKEEHARLCKQQIYILWSDYFKADHYQKYEKLQLTLWLAAKQCSTVKQSLDLEPAEKLWELVVEIDRIFTETKA